MLVLVTYDVETVSPKGQMRLRKVAKACMNYGQRVQNSVFECQVDAAQYATLKHRILEEMDPEKDSVRFYSLGNRHKSKVEHYGVERGIQVDEPLIL